jgi:hypothetical protein
MIGHKTEAKMYLGANEGEAKINKPEINGSKLQCDVS